MNATEPYKFCPYCGRKAATTGETFHQSDCKGLQEIRISRLRLHFLTNGTAPELAPSAQGAKP